MKKILWVTAFIFITCFLFATEIEEILISALDNDQQIKILKKKLEIVIVDYLYAQENDPISLILKTGAKGIGVEWNWVQTNNNFAFFMEPQLSIYAGEELGTRIDVNLFQRTVFSQNTNTNIRIDVAIVQPLNRLFNLYFENDINEMKAFYEVEKARIELLKRSVDVQIDIFLKVSDIYQVYQELNDIEANLIQSESDYNQLIQLGKYEKNSPDYKLIEYQYKKAKLNKDKQKIKLQRQFQDLSRFTGINITALPDILDTPELLLPELDKINQFSDYYLANLNEEIQREKWHQIVNQYPELNLLFKYTNYENEWSQARNDDIAGGVSVAYNNFLISLLTGVKIQENTLYFSLGFSYTFPDFKKEEYERQRAEKDLELAELEKNAAIQELVETFFQLETDYIDTSNNLQITGQEIEIKSIEIEKTQTEIKAGIAIEQDLQKYMFEKYSFESQKNKYIINLYIIILKFQRLLMEDISENHI